MHVSMAKKVLDWYGATKGFQHTLKMKEWLETLRMQLRNILPNKRKDIGELTSQGKWVGCQSFGRLAE